MSEHVHDVTIFPPKFQHNMSETTFPADMTITYKIERTDTNLKTKTDPKPVLTDVSKGFPCLTVKKSHKQDRIYDCIKNISTFIKFLLKKY